MNSKEQAQASRISVIRQETEDAENLGSALKMSEHFSPDIVMMSPNMPSVIGAGNVTDAMRDFFNTFDFEIYYSSEEIVVFGDWAFDRGTYRHKIGPKGSSKLAEETGKYIWLYSLDPESNWKQARIMWNSSDVPVVNDT